MKDDIKKTLIQELSEKYGDNIKEEGSIFVVKNAGTASAPIIPEEVDKVITNVGTVYNLRTGQLAYTIYKNDLIVQYAP